MVRPASQQPITFEEAATLDPDAQAGERDAGEDLPGLSVPVAEPFE